MLYTNKGLDADTDLDCVVCLCPWYTIFSKLSGVNATEKIIFRVRILIFYTRR